MPVDAAADGSALAPEMFRLAVEAFPSGMISVNGDGAIVMINGEVERLFGYRREELLGRPVEILLPDNLRGQHASHRNGFMQRPDARHLGNGRNENNNDRFST
jgi:PAS domain S-box-containing protein